MEGRGEEGETGYKEAGRKEVQGRQRDNGRVENQSGLTHKSSMGNCLKCP